MRAYSEDLRQRVVQAVEDERPRAEVARLFRVSERTIARYLRQQAVTGSLTPAISPGRRRRIVPGDHARMLAQLADAPDATLAMHCARWEQATGVRVSASTWCRMRQRVGWTVKKSR
jgi:transposase